jgi:sugar (pentulose or hexulose) kinase
VLTTAGHDHQAAAVGAGAAGVGDVLDSCGSAEALVRTVGQGVPAADVTALTGAGVTVGWHVLPDRWALLGATEGGLALQRARADPHGDWRGVLEDVTAQAHHVHRTMDRAVGAHRRLVVTGGWARDAAFLDAKRRVFGDLEVSPVEEAGARGAALLAGLAAGSYSAVSELPGRPLGAEP